MKNTKIALMALTLVSFNALSNTPLEDSYIELTNTHVESEDSKNIIIGAKKSLSKVHQELISISYQEKVHQLKKLNIEVKDFKMKLIPMTSIDYSFIDQQIETVLELEKTINHMKATVSQSSIIKINRALMNPYKKLQESIFQYNMDMSIFRSKGFEKYEQMLGFAKKTTDLKKTIIKDKIYYTLTKISNSFCKEYIDKQVDTEFIYDNNRSFITEPLLGWDSLKLTLDNAYEGCHEDS